MFRVFALFALIGLGVALWAVAITLASQGAATACVIVYVLGACAVVLALDAMR